MVLVSGVFKVHGGGMGEFLIDMEEGDRESEEKDEGILAVHHKIGSLRSAGSVGLSLLLLSVSTPPLIIGRETPQTKLNRENKIENMYMQEEGRSACESPFNSGHPTQFTKCKPLNILCS